MGCKSSSVVVSPVAADSKPIEVPKKKSTSSLVMVQPKSSEGEQPQPEGNQVTESSNDLAQDTPAPEPKPNAPLTAAERRALMAAAAEKRGASESSNNNLSVEKHKQMQERRQKDELIGA